MTIKKPKQKVAHEKNDTLAAINEKNIKQAPT